MNRDKTITATFNKIDYTGFTITTDAEGAILEKYSGSRADIAIPPFYEGMPVTRIVENAFQSCTRLTSIIMQGTTPPSLLSGYIFTNEFIPEIKVPSESVGAYQAAWSQYASVIVPYLP